MGKVRVHRRKQLVPRKKPKTAYHHGDLPRALIAVAAEMLAESGVAGFSLREASRRAGVTIGASTHHFGSSRGLLTAVATGAFRELCSVFESVPAEGSDPLEQLIAGVEGYALLSQSIPGPFSIMFRWDLIDKEDPAFAEVGPRSYALFREAVERAASPTSSETDVLAATDTLWAMIHGLVDLDLLEQAETHPSGKLSKAARAKIAFGVKAVVNELRRGASSRKRRKTEKST